jgi:hypothetical protein
MKEVLLVQAGIEFVCFQVEIEIRSDLVLLWHSFLMYRRD